MKISYNNFNGKYWTVIDPKLSRQQRDLDYQGTTVLPNSCNVYFTCQSVRIIKISTVILHSFDSD